MIVSTEWHIDVVSLAFEKYEPAYLLEGTITTDQTPFSFLL